MVEVLFDLCAVEPYAEVKLYPFSISSSALLGKAVLTKYVLVCDSQDTAPSPIAVREIRVGNIEDAIDECEVIFNLLIALDVETVFGLLDIRFEIRHSEIKILEKYLNGLLDLQI